MEELAKTILSKDGIFAFGFFALLCWVLQTNNTREIRYIDTINNFTGRFDGIEEKVDNSEKLMDNKFNTLDRKVDILVHSIEHRTH